MPVTVEQFKSDTSKYINLSETEDILISVDGKVIALLTNPHRDKLKIVESLAGSLPNDGFTVEDARRERLARV